VTVQPVFDLWCIQGDRVVHQSLHGSRQAAQAQGERHKECMALVWDLAYRPAAPVWWARPEMASEFYRLPVLEWEAYLAEAKGPRHVVAVTQPMTARQNRVLANMQKAEDWTKIPREGQHIHEAVARRIHYRDGRAVRTEWKTPGKPAQPATNHAAWEKWMAFNGT
jgi:hypothetical protein